MKSTWCSHCQRNVPTTPVTGTSDARCNDCNRTIKKQFRLESPPESKATKKKKVRKKKKAQTQRASSTIKKVAKRNESPAEFRVDQSHTLASESNRNSTVSSPLLRDSFSRPPVVPLHLAGFGIFLFLVGHILMSWAFIRGTFTLWSIGNLLFVVALVLSLWALSSNLFHIRYANDKLRKRIARLERNLNRSEEPAPAPKQDSPKIVIRSKSRGKARSSQV